MQPVLILQTIFAVFLITLILLQARGTGLGRAWGGEGGFYSTRRGFEKIIFRATIAVALVFVLLSLATLIW